MSKDLTPERRVNKLGHVVTKHVKTASSGVSSRKQLPRVASPVESTHAQQSADADSFAQIKSLQKTVGFAEVQKGIRAGTIRLADIKAIGASRLAPHSSLGEFREILEKYARGECARSIEEMKQFLDKAKRDSLVSGNFRPALPLFEAKPMTEIERLDNLQSFTRTHFKFRDEPDGIEKSFYKALLEEELGRTGMKANGGFWSSTLPREAVALYESGVSIEEAVPLIVQGLSAQQIIGVLQEGVEKSLSGGWL